MAKSHGMTEIEKTLEESLRDMDGIDVEKVIAQAEQYSRRAKTLLPLRPLFIKDESYCKNDIKILLINVLKSKENGP
jgi:hypothetical protein